MKKKLLLLGTVVLVCLMATLTVFAEEVVAEAAAPVHMFIGTFWSLVPPLVAIVLALITKEVYSSLFCGIVVGALLYNQFSLVPTVDTIVQQGLIASVTGTAGNFIFLAVLGALIMLLVVWFVFQVIFAVSCQSSFFSQYPLR